MNPEWVIAASTIVIAGLAGWNQYTLAQLRAFFAEKVANLERTFREEYVTRREFERESGELRDSLKEHIRTYHPPFGPRKHPID